MDFEERKDEGFSVLTQKDFNKLIEKSWDDDSSKYVIKIDHAILEGAYDLRFILTHGCCDIYISNCKLYAFSLMESLWTFSNLTFNNCDVYCPLFVNIQDGTYNNCRIHATDSEDCLALITYNIGCFSNCTFDPPLKLAYPKEGEFVGWKVVKEIIDDGNKVMVRARVLKIRVPKDAKRSSALSNKCRCSKVVPLEVYDLQGNVIKPKGKLYSVYVDLFKLQATPLEYIIGKEVCSDRWDTDRFNECSNGIHFFMKMEEAIQYYYSVCM